MSKKVIIISIASILVVAALVVGILFIIQRNTPQQVVDSTPQPGDAVEIDKTPVYKSCEVVPRETITASFGTNASSFKDSERRGIVARNYEVADECSYSFSTASSEDNQFDIQVYQYGTEETAKGGDGFDNSWRNISKSYDKAYLLDYPAYFSATEASSRKHFTLEILNGPKHYQFAIEQPADGAMSSDTAFNILIELANKANYKTAPVDDSIPPAPNV